jgi:hypothetical protein
MDTMIDRRAGRLAQILAFVMAHLEIFGASAVGSNTVAALQRLVAQLTTLFTTQSAAHATLLDQSAERTKLRDALVQTGTALRVANHLLVQGGKSTADAFPPFRSGKDRLLVADAQAAYDKAVTLKADFEGHGLAASVIDSLPAQIAAVNNAIGKQKGARATHKAGRQTVEDALRDAPGIVKTLDSIIRTVPNVDPLVMEQWKATKRVGPKRVTAGTETPPPAQTAAADKKTA